MMTATAAMAAVMAMPRTMALLSTAVAVVRRGPVLIQALLRLRWLRRSFQRKRRHSGRLQL